LTDDEFSEKVWIVLEGSGKGEEGFALVEHKPKKYDLYFFK